MSNSRQLTDRSGFSMIELLSVIVIIGLMTAIALPKSGIASYRANSGAQVVSSALSYAQRQAISRQADTRVAFDLANNRMRVHEDRNNDNIIDADERVTFANLPEGITFGRGTAPARAMGGEVVTFTRAQGILPVLVFHRDGTASEDGGVYVTTIAGLAVDRTADVRAVEISRATGRPTWFSYGTGTWKERQ
ncbi:MAG TPA: prepilin-type N-terminal cleavage/methylation domain-containing protein [Gemmatimonadales bacterium]|nr:prepilin-type N-terminal cleavage/methylation domain-containing protein [Gemmatimonadales bacterium]